MRLRVPRHAIEVVTVGVAGKVYAAGLTVLCLAMFQMLPRDRRKFAGWAIAALLVLTTIIRIQDGSY